MRESFLLQRIRTYVHKLVMILQCRIRQIRTGYFTFTARRQSLFKLSDVACSHSFSEDMSIRVAILLEDMFIRVAILF